jgi:beta-glucosidase
MRNALILFAVISILLSCKQKNSTKLFSSNAEVERKLDSLLSLMTLEEKIGQTVLFSSHGTVTGPVLDDNYINYLKEGQVGAIFNATSTDFIRKLQKIAVEETRLGIPLLFGYDVIHGYKTVFPIPLGESCSWDLELLEQTAKVAAREASSIGLHWTFAPMIDVSRDPRWGRVAEGNGEDTYLTSQITTARILGYQGDDLSDPETILSCAKHFAAYGAPQAGRDYHTVDMSEITLRNVYLPPFKAAVQAGAATFMTAFNELNGVPATANPLLLDQILRKEWGFDGFVVTDYTSINEMVYHGNVKSVEEAGEVSMNSGVDMDMQGGVFRQFLAQSVKDGKVDEERITEAARSVLRMKYLLGLFDDPYRYLDAQNERDVLLHPNHLELARISAAKSMVLLKNKYSVLPLQASQKIALIGPLADDEYHILGNWIGQGDRTGTAVSVKEAFEARGAHFSYAKGCEIDGSNKAGFEKALQVANNADVIVLVVGESERMSGEAASRTSISLPDIQKELIEVLSNTGKPIVLVLFNGRPLDLSWESTTADAILETWFSGTSGGHAVADVLYGDINPSGKLTMSFPRNVGQIPVFYNEKYTGRPHDLPGANERYTSKYIDVPNSPLYPFGFGLSYTTFAYENVTLSNDVITATNPIKASVEITNTGNYAGEEVVQLYVKDKVGSITRPVKELKGFKKVFLEKGETQKVSFEVTVEDLMFYNSSLEKVAESGVFELMIAPHSDHPFTHSLKLE